MLLTLTLLFAASLATNVQAAVKDLNGYAWSSNIGWISFHGANYGVTIDDQNGNLDGFAWSSNIGWIRFKNNPFYPCPTGGSTCQPNVNLTSGAVTGWVRACSATKDKACGDILASDGTWDGWIKLGAITGISGTGVTYNITTGKFGGFAWGDKNVGWLKFNWDDNGDDDVDCPTCGSNMSCRIEGGQVPNTNNIRFTTTIENDTQYSSYTLTRDGFPLMSPNSNPFLMTDNGLTAGPHIYRLTRAGGATCQTTFNVSDSNTVTGKLYLGLNPNTTQISMDIDDYVDVRWNVSPGLTCHGTQLSGPEQISGWTSLTAITAATGVHRVENLDEGDYTLGMTCLDGATNVPVNNVILNVVHGELDEI